MWVKGHAGTGKTMLLIGILRELSSQPTKLAPNISHFFCQGTDKALNSATATLRSLLWVLLVQQPHFISHLRSKHRYAGSSLFKGANAFIALSEAFKSILNDPHLSPVYFIVDALDECEQGLPDLIQLISTSLAITDKVKWLVSSRPTVELKNPDTAGSLLELDAQRLKNPVNTYIEYKLSTLKTKIGYDDSVLADVSDEVRRGAKYIFLWVALVFKELDSVEGWYAADIIRAIPSGLSELYGHIMSKIEKGNMRDPEFCKEVLVATALSYRPLSLSELGVVAGLPPKVNPQTIVEKCGSFLTTRESIVDLIHQSAKDYLKNCESRLQEAGIAEGHVNISRRSVKAMSLILKQNIYTLQFGFKPRDMRPPDPDPLAPIRYSCVFWADHLCFLNGEDPKYRRELIDDGPVFGFLKERFLYWLESLSLLGRLSDGVQSIRKLLYIARVGYNSCSYMQILSIASLN
jgi:NACHT domain